MRALAKNEIVYWLNSERAGDYIGVIVTELDGDVITMQAADERTAEIDLEELAGKLEGCYALSSIVNSGPACRFVACMEDDTCEADAVAIAAEYRAVQDAGHGRDAMAYARALRSLADRVEEVGPEDMQVVLGMLRSAD